MNDTAETGESQSHETSSVSKTCPNCASSANDKDSRSSLKILNEIHRMYEERLNNIAREGKGDVLKLQNQTFRTWVNDLVEQNALLVRTVEELEVEATKRVTLLEQRINEENKKYNEIEMELRSEITILQKKLRRKDSDLRGLIEVIRRLREQEYWNLDGLHFLEVTKSDIFGSPKRKLTERILISQQRQPYASLSTQPHFHDCSWTSRENCDRLLELKLINDTLERENLSKDIEIKSITDDIKEKESTILNLRNLLSATCIKSIESKIFRNAETMTSSFEVQLSQCGVACKQGSSHNINIMTQTDDVIEVYENKIALLQTQLQNHIKSDTVTNEHNVGTNEELRGLQRRCYCLEEQYRSSLSRSQFKDDIIREMRYQLKQAKARLQPERHCNAKYSHRLEDWVSGDHPTLLKISSSSEKDFNLSNSRLKMKLICCNTEKGNFSGKLGNAAKRVGHTESMKNSEVDFECLFPKDDLNEKTVNTTYVKRRNALKLPQPKSARSVSSDQLNSVHLT